jgi:hypothetical protein
MCAICLQILKIFKVYTEQSQYKTDWKTALISHPSNMSYLGLGRELDATLLSATDQQLEDALIQLLGSETRAVIPASRDDRLREIVRLTKEEMKRGGFPDLKKLIKMEKYDKYLIERMGYTEEHVSKMSYHSRERQVWAHIELMKLMRDPQTPEFNAEMRRLSGGLGWIEPQQQMLPLLPLSMAESPTELMPWFCVECRTTHVPEPPSTCGYYHCY